MFVIYCILRVFSTFVGWRIDCKNTHSMNNIKCRKILCSCFRLLNKTNNFNEAWLSTTNYKKAATAYFRVLLQRRHGGSKKTASNHKTESSYEVFSDVQSTHETNFSFMWPRIVTNFLIIKSTRCTNFSNSSWKWNSTWIWKFHPDPSARKLSTNLYDI
jgi:hypothetical protein